MAEVATGSLEELVCWCSGGRGCPLDLAARLLPLMDDLEAMIDATIKEFDPLHVRRTVFLTNHNPILLFLTLDHPILTEHPTLTRIGTTISQT